MALSREIKDILADRFEAWELCEFLQIDALDFIEVFEDEIEENWEDVKDFAEFRGGDDEA